MRSGVLDRMRVKTAGHFAQVRSVAPLEALVTESLEELFCAVNKIPEIVGISHLTTLGTLELGSNRLQARRCTTLHAW